MEYLFFFFFLMNVLGRPFHLTNNILHTFLNFSPHYQAIGILVLEEDVISSVLALNLSQY